MNNVTNYLIWLNYTWPANEKRNTNSSFQIIALSSLTSVFEMLKRADPENGSSIEGAIRRALAEHHATLREDASTPDRERYHLFRSAVELKAQASSFLNYEREMAQRELWVSPTVNAGWGRRIVDGEGEPTDFFQRMSRLASLSA